LETGITVNFYDERENLHRAAAGALGSIRDLGGLRAVSPPPANSL